MSSPLDTIKSAVLGTPPVASKRPSRQGVVKAFAEMETKLNAAQSGALVFDTLADLNAAATVPSANIMAWVTGDATLANNGIYQNTGSAATPSWTRRADIPQFFISGINAGAGTVDAIQITTDLPVPTADGACLISVPVLGANTTTTPTVSINGGTALTIVGVQGGPIVVGGLIGNGSVVGYISNSGTEFKLIINPVTNEVLHFKNVWDGGTTYLRGDSVSDDNKLYVLDAGSSLNEDPASGAPWVLIFDFVSVVGVSIKNTVAEMTGVSDVTLATVNQISLNNVNRGGSFEVLPGSAASNSLTVDNGTVFEADSGNYTFRRIYDGLPVLEWFGSVGDWDDGAETGTDNTAIVQAVMAAHDAIYIKSGLHRTTLAVTALTSSFFGHGRLTTVDSASSRRRANNHIAITSAPTIPMPANGIFAGFDGDLGSSLTFSGLVTGTDTVGDPALSYDGEGNYTLSPAASIFYNANYFSSGKNKSPFNTGGRTGWCVDTKQLTHSGKGDGWMAFWNVFVDQSDNSILKTHGAPAGGQLGGIVSAGDDDVILQGSEVSIKDNGYDVVGKGLVFNLVRTNAAAAKNQFWAGVRLQSSGSEKVDSGFQLVGLYRNGLDFTAATIDRAITLATGQGIYFDGTANQILGADQWVTATGYTAGDITENANNVYQADNTGTSGGTAPTHTSGSVSDGGVTWTWLGGHNFKGYCSSTGGTFIQKAGASLAVSVGGVTKFAFGSGNNLTYAGINPAADVTHSLGNLSLKYLDVFSSRFRVGSAGTQILSGTGSPEGVVTAPVGSIFLRTDGGASTTIYIKESGSGNTGWVAK